ncbi:MAG: esterase-like activity of phytase family protein, partial [Bacteroidota bacterium]
MKTLKKIACLGGLMVMFNAQSQITLLKDYTNNYSQQIGTFQNINFREAGFSGLYPIAGTNGKEFWTVSDRGVNVDAANANLTAVPVGTVGCKPTYDKIYGFPTYAPKIHRIRVVGDSVQILQTLPIKRPNGTTATGLLNPTGFGSTSAEVPSIDTVLNCSRFNLKTVAKDIWGIDSEGIAVDKDGNFWLCEEGGPTIWKLNASGKVLKRFTPYGNLPGIEPEDTPIDTVFKYRKNNRGFEGITITPNGKIYAIIQSPLLYPNKTIGEATRVHRIVEINPSNNAVRMFAYLNDGIIGASGANQIRLRDWKIGDLAAINDSTFLVLEAALRGTSDFKRIYLININQATPVNSGLYGGLTLEALVDATGLTANSIKPVTKTLFMDLLANSWPSALDKAEGLAIINDSTIAIGNDNDYAQTTAGGAEDGVAVATTNKSHVFVYRLSGVNKIKNYKTLSQGITGPSTLSAPYLSATAPSAKFTSILTVGESIGSYTLSGLGDGLGAYDNNNGTFTLLMGHEIGSTLGSVRAHGS